MKKRLPNEGFSAVVVMIAILVLAVVGLIGWRALADNNKTTNNNSNQQANNSQKPDNETKYLTIKEWGIKIPLSDEISEAYYSIRTDDSGEYVELYDTGFDKLNNRNGVPCGGDNKYQFYSISRIKSDDYNALSEEDRNKYQKFSFTDEWWFSGTGAHQAPPYCFGQGPNQEDPNILEIADNKEKAFNDAFKDLKSAD